MESSSLSSFPSPSSLSSDVDASLNLSDRLRAFKTSQFDADAYVTTKCQTMNEKEIKHLCSYLVELKKASAEEMRKSVYANYAAFIRTSKEISDLEGQLISMRSLLSSQAGFVHSLAQGVRVNKVLNEDDDDDDARSGEWEERRSSSNSKNKNEGRVAEFVDEVEVLLAERRMQEALKAVETAPAWVPREAVGEQRRRLAEELAESMERPWAARSELRSAAAALRRLGEGGRAHGLLLRAHERRMRGAAPKAAFAGLLRAAEDSLAGFSDEPGYLSGLVTWAVGQAEDVAHQARRRVLASGGLRAAGDCVRLCLGHCAELEARGLSLSSAVVRIFRPMLDHALASSLAAVRHSASALAAADDWSLTAHHHPNLSSSAYKFSSMLQELVEDMEPLENFRMEGAALEGVLQEFNSYVDLLVSALPPSIADATGLVENKLVKRAKTETQQIALLGNAWVLADEVLPRVALSLHGETGPTRQRDWKRRFQRCVDRLRDSFCRNHALELIFTDEGDSRLSPQTYTTMDLTSTAPEWFPSPIFQVLFTKLMRIAGICSQVFVGRERCATVLLIRLLETVILFLSNDQSFWEEIESGEQPLGPQGLQQFYLDMEFVLLFSSQGRFLSRNMHQVIKDIIDRAVDAVQATGIDPYRVLPKGDWFAEMAQIAINILTGKHSFSDEETDPNTPTDSSIYSHGANFD